MKWRKWTGVILILMLVMTAGCVENRTGSSPAVTGGRIKSLQRDAEILFLARPDPDSRVREIYAMDGEGGSRTRISYTGAHHFLLGLDPSGRYLAATRAVVDTDPPDGLGDEDRKSLWLIDLQTGEERALTDQDAFAEGDSFSPDGEWLVLFMRPPGEETSDIYKIRRDGTELTRLTDTPRISEYDPAWSHAGEQIAFVSYDPETPHMVLTIMGSMGDVRTVYDGGQDIATPRFPPGNYDPSFSPGDQWLVFERPVGFDHENGDAGVWHIFKIRLDGTDLIDLSEAGGHGDGAEYLPSFSPDGRWILFTSRHGAEDPAQVRVDIFRTDADGGSLKRLTGSEWGESAIWIR